MSQRCPHCGLFSRRVVRRAGPHEAGQPLHWTGFPRQNLGPARCDTTRQWAGAEVPLACLADASAWSVARGRPDIRLASVASVEDEEGPDGAEIFDTAAEFSALPSRFLGESRLSSVSGRLAWLLL